MLGLEARRSRAGRSITLLNLSNTIRYRLPPNIANAWRVRSVGSARLSSSRPAASAWPAAPRAASPRRVWPGCRAGPPGCSGSPARRRAGRRGAGSASPDRALAHPADPAHEGRGRRGSARARCRRALPLRPTKCGGSGSPPASVGATLAVAPWAGASPAPTSRKFGRAW